MKQIKFTASGCSTWTGNFAPGDVARLDDAAAKHLVEEARCAQYMTAETSAETVQKPAAKKSAKKKAS
ncbi:MAG TPA: hypothetical protein VLC71_05925 [Thermomonas sp.]|nr:hypothetical protein [Thermomonas sp.]